MVRRGLELRLLYQVWKEVLQPIPNETASPARNRFQKSSLLNWVVYPAISNSSTNEKLEALATGP